MASRKLGQQLLPAVEVVVLGDHVQINEKVASSDRLFSGLLPQVAHFVTYGLEGDEVEYQ